VLRLRGPIQLLTREDVDRTQRNTSSAFGTAAIAAFAQSGYLDQGGTMLRVELHDSILKLEGRLTSVDAEHIRTLIAHSDMLARILVDLTEVTFVDSVGETVLSLLGQLGAEFVAETAYSLDVCERLELPLAHGATARSDRPEIPKCRSRAYDA